MAIPWKDGIGKIGRWRIVGYSLISSCFICRRPCAIIEFEGKEKRGESALCLRPDCDRKMWQAVIHGLDHWNPTPTRIH